MGQYVEYVADFLLWRLGYGVRYGQENPVRPLYIVSIGLSLTSRRVSTSSRLWRGWRYRLARTSSTVRSPTIMGPPLADPEPGVSIFFEYVVRLVFAS